MPISFDFFLGRARKFWGGGCAPPRHPPRKSAPGENLVKKPPKGSEVWLFGLESLQNHKYKYELSFKRVSREASPTFGHANANFSLFIDRIRNQFLKK